MSALSKFLDRHGLDEGFRAKAGLYASMAAVAAATLLAPMQALAYDDSYIASRDSRIGGAGMSERLGMVAVRINDRLGDMVAISNALHKMPELARGRDGDLAAKIVIEINNRLYQQTPNPQLADFDLAPLGLPANLAEGATMEYGVSAINFQKQTLQEATSALEDIVAAYQRGTRSDVNRAVDKLDSALENYRVSEPHVLQTIKNSLRNMRTDEGWTRGVQGY